MSLPILPVVPSNWMTWVGENYYHRAVLKGTNVTPCKAASWYNDANEITVPGLYYRVRGFTRATDGILIRYSFDNDEKTIFADINYDSIIFQEYQWESVRHVLHFTLKPDQQVRLAVQYKDGEDVVVKMYDRVPMHRF